MVLVSLAQSRSLDSNHHLTHEWFSLTRGISAALGPLCGPVTKALFGVSFGPVFVRDGRGTGPIALEMEAQLEGLRVLVSQDSLPHIRRACGVVSRC